MVSTYRAAAGLARALRHAVAIVVLVVPTFAGAAECVHPNESVVRGVVQREGPSTETTRLGLLAPGQSLELVAIVPNWYEVRTDANHTAFVSKRWLVVGDCGAAPPAPGAFAPAAAGPTYTVDAFDVGTGLSVLIRGADFSLLYDAGSNDDTTLQPRNRAVAYLKAATPALTRLDHVILSHPHKDHFHLMPEVISEFPPREVWYSGARSNLTCGYFNFLRAIASNPAIQYHTATMDAGQETEAVPPGTCNAPDTGNTDIVLQHASRLENTVIRLGQGASMEFLYIDGTKRSDPNDNSLVTRVILGSRRILLMGDADGGPRKPPSEPASKKSIEGTLLQCCVQDLFADVLVVGHHGSMTSSRSAFLSAVDASIYIVSSGPFGYSGVVLPDDEVLDALRARGGALFQTDLTDDACLTSPAKIGTDNDGKPGGCDSVRLVISGSQPIQASYLRNAD